MSAINLFLHTFFSFSFNLHDLLLIIICMFQCVCVSGSLATSAAVLQLKHILEKNTFYLQLAQIAGYADVNTNGVLLPSAGCI